MGKNGSPAAESSPTGHLSPLAYSVCLGAASLLSYWLATEALAEIHSVGHDDDLLGGMWAVIATVFVYRTSTQESLRAAWSRILATLLSIGLCLAYLLVLPFHPWGLAVLIGIGSLLMLSLGRPEDVVTTGVTTAVVMVVAALSPESAWQQPILRLADTVIGVAVGLAAARLLRE
jgi:uncharacterized membrane protein YccC